jgi:hypothetical protein
MTTVGWRGRDIAVHIKEAVLVRGPVQDGTGSQHTTSTGPRSSGSVPPHLGWTTDAASGKSLLRPRWRTWGGRLALEAVLPGPPCCPSLIRQCSGEPKRDDRPPVPA